MPSGIGLLLLLVAVAAAGGGVAAARTIGEQPLSLIGIHRATVGIDAAASVEAWPRLLGVKGEDTAWVTVSFAAPHASDGDWIGVFSPSNFNASTCPGSYGSDPGPVICSAPIKYQLANYSSDYGKSGRGTLKFLLINQRQDFSFALFTGGLSNPKLIAVSNKIAFANPKAPVYPRLAQGKSWNEMTVTWTSGYDIQEAYPFVEWGMKWNPPTRTAAGTENLLVLLVGEIQIGHMLPDGQVVWGKFNSFKAPPFPGQKSLQRVVIFGDMGKAERDGSNEYSNYQPGSLNTTDTLIKDLDNIDIVFHIGDITYANGYISQWDQFTQQVEPITARVPYMIASGNHERDWPNSGSFFNGTDSGGECGVLAETMYYTPTENRANYWYQTDYGMFRFCVADSEHDWREGTDQYAFLERCLSTVDRKKQPWLIFIAHRVLGYSSGFFYGTGAGATFAEPTSRRSLQKLWRDHRVDLAFYGHVHNYERTCPVYDEKCVISPANSSNSHYSGVMNGGTIHAVVGGGGSHLSNFTVETPEWSVYREMDYGFVKLTAFNYTTMVYEYKRSSDGKVYDSFTVHREYRDVLACVDGSCPPTIPTS
uniref:Purple acid phosphatase n=1 Tax=Leersia perrieri TaxID=77586 RepID=A0A0D9XFE4_9ORYZ